MASSCGEDASKTALRDCYIAARKSLRGSLCGRVSLEIQRHFLALPAYRKTSLLLAYYPYRDEIDTIPIIKQAWEDGKHVALPRCVGGTVSLAYYEVSSLEGLCLGARGVLEPPAAARAINPKDLPGSVCLVPGLVFDARGYRIGYGAGYYDNFLATYPGFTVGLAPSLQISGNPLPIDDHDIAVDALVSDGAIWMCRQECD